jgi:hypothetical protein
LESLRRLQLIVSVARALNPRVAALKRGFRLGAAYLNGRGKGARWDSTTDP